MTETFTSQSGITSIEGFSEQLKASFSRENFKLPFRDVLRGASSFVRLMRDNSMSKILGATPKQITYLLVPKSERSKVALELAETMMENSYSREKFQANIQHLVELVNSEQEQWILAVKLDSYGIAHKEQFGDHRELGIQTLEGRLESYFVEQISYEICREVSSNNVVESMSHKKSKVYSMDDATQKASRLASEIISSKDRNQFGILGLNKDHSKWGPITNFRYSL